MAAIRFFVDDRLIEEAGVSPATTLLRYLRDHLGCSGTKEGCAEGDCGACTVAVLEPDDTGRRVYRAINSCLVPLPSLHGRRVYTAEGISRNGRLHQVQRALVDSSGSQCGYCTPGIAVMVAWLNTAGSRMENEPITKLLEGNLCRCTGYQQLIEAVIALR